MAKPRGHQVGRPVSSASYTRAGIEFGMLRVLLVVEEVAGEATEYG